MGTKKRACSWRSCSRTRSARIPSYCTSATPNQIETPLRNRSETPEGGAYVNTSCQVLSDLCQTNKTVRARTHVHGSSQTHFRESTAKTEGAKHRLLSGTRKCLIGSAPGTFQGTFKSVNNYQQPFAHVHRGSPSAVWDQRSTEKASQVPRGGRWL